MRSFFVLICMMISACVSAQCIHRVIQNLASGNVGASDLQQAQPLAKQSMCKHMLDTASCKDEDADAANGQFLNHDVYNLENNKILPLVDVDNFLIYYVFADNDIEKQLKDEMINHLKKIGVVFSGDDNKLTEQQKERKYKIGSPILDIIVSSIIEKSDASSHSYKQLPVIELSLKVKAGVQSIENGSQMLGVIWEDYRYISTKCDKKQLIQKATKSFGELLNNFKDEYEKANPHKGEEKPQFYLYS